MGASRLAPRLLLAAASVAITLVLFEVALQLAHAAGSARAPVDPLAQLYAPSPNPAIVFEHVPGARVAFPPVAVGERTTAAWEVRIEANGLRANGRAGPPAELRGICLGDSVMFGVGLNDHETIPAQLGELVTKGLGRRFECLNFGVSNYTTAQEVAYFRHRDALRHDPSIVVLGIYTNDFKTSLGRIEVIERQTRLVSPGARGALAARLGDLQLVRRATAAVHGVRDRLRVAGLYPHANAKPLRPAQVQAVYGALDELRALLEPRDIPLLLVLFPRDWQLGAADRESATERQRAALAYCRSRGVACVDLLDHYYGRPVASYFRPGDDSHPHAEAARESAAIVAEAVVAILAPRPGAG